MPKPIAVVDYPMGKSYGDADEHTTVLYEVRDLADKVEVILLDAFSGEVHVWLEFSSELYLRWALEKLAAIDIHPRVRYQR